MDSTLLLIVVAFGIFLVFQVISGRKRRRETEERVARFVPGVEIMTNTGLYGTILEIDEETNVVTLESTPGTVLRVHRQTLLKVADYAPATEVADDDVSDGAVSAGVADHRAADDVAAIPAESPRSADATEPAFGERTDGPAIDRPDDSGSRRPSTPLDGA